MAERRRPGGRRRVAERQRVQRSASPKRALAVNRRVLSSLLGGGGAGRAAGRAGWGCPAAPRRASRRARRGAYACAGLRCSAAGSFTAGSFCRRAAKSGILRFCGAGRGMVGPRTPCHFRQEGRGSEGSKQPHWRGSRPCKAAGGGSRAAEGSSRACSAGIERRACQHGGWAWARRLPPWVS